MSTMIDSLYKAECPYSFEQKRRQRNLLFLLIPLFLIASCGAYALFYIVQNIYLINLFYFVIGAAFLSICFLTDEWHFVQRMILYLCFFALLKWLIGLTVFFLPNKSADLPKHSTISVLLLFGILFLPPIFRKETAQNSKQNTRKVISYCLIILFLLFNSVCSLLGDSIDLIVLYGEIGVSFLYWSSAYLEIGLGIALCYLACILFGNARKSIAHWVGFGFTAIFYILSVLSHIFDHFWYYNLVYYLMVDSKWGMEYLPASIALFVLAALLARHRKKQNKELL